MRSARNHQERALTDTLKNLIKYDIFAEMQEYIPKERFELARLNELKQSM
jgi:hypothetical protein